MTPTSTCHAATVATVFTAAVMTTSVAQSAPITKTTGDLLFFQGGTNSEGLQNFNQNGAIEGSFTRTLTGLSSNIAGNADVTLTAQGDFDSSFETVALDIDGISLGTFLNEDSNDDEFNNRSFGDEGFDDAQDGSRTSSASVDLSSALSNGKLDLTYQFPDFSGVDDQIGIDFVRTDIAYDTASTSVPTPTSIALLGIGLLGLSLTARRRRLD